MTKTIYNCRCWTIKDGSIANGVCFCRKHNSSWDVTDTLDQSVTKIEAFGEDVAAITNVQGGQTWISEETLPI